MKRKKNKQKALSLAGAPQIFLLLSTDVYRTKNKPKCFLFYSSAIVEYSINFTHTNADRLTKSMALIWVAAIRFHYSNNVFNQHKIWSGAWFYQLILHSVLKHMDLAIESMYEQNSKLLPFHKANEIQLIEDYAGKIMCIWSLCSDKLPFFVSTSIIFITFFLFSHLSWIKSIEIKNVKKSDQFLIVLKEHKFA